MRAKHGHLIAVEGIDNSGKTTLVNSIRPTLISLGLNATILREFSASLGAHIYRLIIEQADTFSAPAQAMLLAAGQLADLAHLQYVLDDPKGVVLADRYSDSNSIYQSIKYAGENEAYSKKAEQLRVWIGKLYAPPHLKPDMTILLNISVEEALKRASETRKPSTKSIEFLRLAQDLFLKIAQEYPSRYLVLDGASSREETSRQAVEAIVQLVKQENHLSSHSETR